LDKEYVILFDGICNLCNGFINFVIQRDDKRKIYYGSLQSESSKELLKKYNIQLGDSFSTIYFLKKGKLYQRSTAILQVVKELSKFYSVLSSIAMLVPEFIRDSVYSFISKNRYLLFGKKDTCRMPTLEERNQFI
jgi:predicted DCC family thiol-disulfide oxidoreductase YuxK